MSNAGKVTFKMFIKFTKTFELWKDSAGAKHRTGIRGHVVGMAAIRELAKLSPG